jgi:hypothetical protein
MQVGYYVRFEVSTAVTMMIIIFWEMIFINLLQNLVMNSRAQLVDNLTTLNSSDTI